MVSTQHGSGSSGLGFNLDTEMTAGINRMWEGLVTTAMQSNPAFLSYPWETGIAGKVLFPKAESAMLHLRPSRYHPGPYSLPGPVTSAVDTAHLRRVEQVVKSGSWAKVAKRTADIPWDEAVETDRDLALKKWKFLIQLTAEHSNLGRRLVGDILNLRTDDELVGLISDLFARKSTLTLHRRANSIVGYVKYCKGIGLPCFPVTVGLVYRYLRSSHMRASSSAQSFREALNFCHGLIGLDDAAIVAADPIISGSAFKALCEKPLTKQAVPLTVAQIDKLIGICCDGEDDLDRIFAGHCILAISLRARWNDLQNVNYIKEDFVCDFAPEAGMVGYIEVGTVRHKTAVTAAKRTTILPMTGPLKILGNSTWFDSWQCSRKANGLKEFGFPLMPSVDINGKFTSMPLTTSAASLWIKDLLSDDADTCSCTTHSLKTTFLSWAAKRGLDYEDRCLLGYHQVPGRSSVYCYSRDVLARPLQKLDDLLAEVFSRKFRPDDSRAKRAWAGQDDPLINGFDEGETIFDKLPDEVLESPVPLDDSHKELEDSFEGAEVLSSGSDSTSESESGDARGISVWSGVSERCERNLCADKDFELVFHTRRCTVHRRSLLRVARTLCGRWINCTYEQLDNEPELDVPLCKLCFR